MAATLRCLLLVDSAGERLVSRARVLQEGVMLVGDEDDFDELLDSVATETNHDEDRRRQKGLDAAYEALAAALDEARASELCGTADDSAAARLRHAHRLVSARAEEAGVGDASPEI